MKEEIRLIICIPTAGMVRTHFAYSLARLTAYLAALKIPSRSECDVKVEVDVVESSNWLTNREQLVSHAIKMNQTHLLFLDDDMIFEPQVIDIMFGRRQAIVCTNYLIKTDPPQDFVAVNVDGTRVPTKESSTGLVPIGYSGFGVSLFEVDVFKNIPQPWFEPKFVAERNEYTTEDNPCYTAMRKAGYTVYLDHDASKLVSHMGNKVWKWDQVKELTPEEG